LLPHRRYACGFEIPVSSESVDEDWVVWAFTLLCIRAVNYPSMIEALTYHASKLISIRDQSSVPLL
jgi:hypothetical protein